MGRALFGTDGVRGVANRQLTPELALRLGEAVVGVWLLRRHRPGYIRLPSAEVAPLIDQWPLE